MWRGKNCSYIVKSLNRISYFIILTIMFIDTQLVYGRDNFWPAEDTPLSIVFLDGSLLCAHNRPNLSLTYEDNHLLVKYDFETQEISFIYDNELPKKIYSLSYNKNYIFAGGTGLSIYDKINKSWKRWSKFDSLVINEIVADEKQIWLGTNAKGVIGVELHSGNKTFYNKSTGLNSNNVYSLMLLDSLLFVGTYRWGTGKWDERKEDIFGLGLSKINLKTCRISKIPLPKLNNEYNLKTDHLVVDMYTIPTEENVIKLVLWYPWRVECWEYNYISNKFRKSTDCEHHLQGIFYTYGDTEKSELASHLIKFILKVGINKWCGGGLPNPIAFETIQLIYRRGEYKTIESLLNDSGPRVRTQTILQISKIKAPIISSYLLGMQNKETDSETKRELIKILLNYPDPNVRMQTVRQIPEAEVKDFFIRSYLIDRKNEETDSCIIEEISKKLEK